MLCHADEDKARVGLTQPRRGVFSRVAGALSLSSPGARQPADDSLADQWLDFLIQQADAADAASNAAAASGDSGAPTEQPKSAMSVNLAAEQYPASRPLHDWNSMQSPRT